MKMKKWIITRGSRFYDVVGILILTLCVDAMMRGIEAVKEAHKCALCLVSALFWLVSALFIMKAVHDLRIFEMRSERKERQEKEYDKDAVYQLMAGAQQDLSNVKRIGWGFLLALLAAGMLVWENLLPQPMTSSVKPIPLVQHQLSSPTKAPAAPKSVVLPP